MSDTDRQNAKRFQLLPVPVKRVLVYLSLLIVYFWDFGRPASLIRLSLASRVRGPSPTRV